ncbi:PREDICTED: squamous cell carcinoma antigen recognized by T-cells 3-like [Nicrophorus vespilloides]|uniref:Squamous cell carcinoma antigen recognized by T-cells 3-like n=1 Tax=Nicrophorus vespilloides TaxID=110193 RepID=A0ABM1MAM3_NICVS|nr:PREDICTED: squamous cell carcinoma antigen recognized by T-cells 3-like [Nicrophorus vespilloides]
MDEDDNKLSTDSDSSDEEDKALMKRAEEIEGLLSNNKYLYDLHVELVGLYQKIVDLVSLRQAYKRFYNIYPLTDTLWLNWLKIEMELATGEEEKKNVLELFEKATKDYLSVKLWLEYAQHAMGCCSLEETRTILEKGLNAVGLHVCNGSLLWDTLREFELANLSMCQQNSENYKMQLKKVVSTFRRQLSVPLLNMEITYEEWNEFLKSVDNEELVDNKAVDWGYKNALKILETYKPFEDKLLTATADQEIYNIFKEYIKSVKDPSVILCLYERAVEKICLLPDIWLDYCYYAYGLGECSVSISERAVRNVTWSEDLWVLRLRILEKNNVSDADVRKCYQDGIHFIQNGLDLWMSYLDYIKRNSPDQLMDLFEKAEETEVDPTRKITRLHARLLFKSEEATKARKLWNSIMHDPICKQNYVFWLELINLERQFGTVTSVRETFRKAINCCKTEQIIYDEWLLFERECGSVEDLVKCTEKLRTVHFPIIQATHYQEAVETNVKKRKRDAEPSGNKKVKQNDGNRKLTDELRFKKNDSKNVGLVRNQGAPENLDHAKSVFVSNLAYNVTADSLAPVFPNSKITLSTNNKGLSRCFGYIEFKTEEEAEAALLRDREPFEGRPIFISKCKTNKAERQKMFQFSENLELNKLFVKGLPFAHTKEDVEKMYKDFNCLDVRLVMHKTGQSKGLAYVDFGNETDAANALNATNQMKVGEFVIDVAISAPPSKRKEFPEPFKAPERTLKLFVPRSVTKIQQPSTTTKTTTTNNKPMKSNNDFRNMLVKK